MNPDIEKRIAALVKRHRKVDASTIAAYVEGTLPAAKRLSLERTLAADPEAQLMLRELKARNIPKMPVMVSIAALIAVILGASIWALRGEDVETSVGVQLADAAAQLRAEGGERFREFELLSDEELQASTIRRGGGRWLAPRGSILEAPTTFKWELPHGASKCAIRLRGPGVDWRVEHTGQSIKAPKLVPGRYTVSMRALDALAGQVVRSSFVVLDEDQQAKTRESFGMLRDRCEDSVEDLLVSHYAFRRQLYGEAMRSATKARRSAGELERPAQALLDHFKALGLE